MDFDRPYSALEIADLTRSELIGSGTINILLVGLNEIHHVRNGDITFCDHPKYMETALQSAASCIIVNQKRVAPEGKVLLYNVDPFRAYNSLVSLIVDRRYLFVADSSGTLSNEQRSTRNKSSDSLKQRTDIHPTAIIETGAVIGVGVKIGAQSFIGAQTVIYSETVIGQNVHIGAQSVIGSDAFYFKRAATKSEKWVSGGGVVIADNVDIGALCTINKGVSTNTTIGAHTKIDCHVHVGHDSVIGAHCLIAAQVGISGNVIIEDNVIIYGQVGIAQNVRIGAGAIILGQTGVSKSIEGGKKYFGTPVQDVGIAFRQLAKLKKL